MPELWLPHERDPYVSRPNDPACPECDTPRAADGTPACSCARRASEARRDARTADAAAAEDFDPVRIRPFVELGDDNARTPEAAGAPPATTAAVPQEAGNSTGKENGSDGSPTSPPTAESAPGEPPVVAPDGRRRRRRTLLITGAGATAAALLTGAFLGGLFRYDRPSRDDSLSDDVRAPVPAGSTDDGTSPEGRSAGTASASPAARPTPSPATTPAGESPTPSRSATPTVSPSSPSAAAATPSAPQEQNPILRFGDGGPEVTELQLRLRQIGYYAGDIDGDYDREVEGAVRAYQLTRVILGDESGVYGTATRQSLESETSEP